jgi:transcriptional regulator with XRE-family HTH domain
MKRLRELRKENELTLMKLADKIGYHYRSVADWETGKCEPSILAMMCLADVFNVSIDYLVGRTGRKDNYDKRTNRQNSGAV